MHLKLKSKIYKTNRKLQAKYKFGSMQNWGRKRLRENGSKITISQKKIFLRKFANK